MYTYRDPDGSLVTSPTYMGAVSLEEMANATQNCEHEWKNFGAVELSLVPGCEVRMQACAKCGVAVRARVTGPKAAIDAYAATLRVVESQPFDPSHN